MWCHFLSGPMFLPGGLLPRKEGSWGEVWGGCFSNMPEGEYQKATQTKLQLKWFFQCNLWSLSNSRARGCPVTLPAQRKVMFSEACFSHSVHKDVMSLPVWSHVPSRGSPPRKEGSWGEVWGGGVFFKYARRWVSEGYSNKTAVKVILSMRSLVSIEQQSPRMPCDITSTKEGNVFRSMF